MHKSQTSYNSSLLTFFSFLSLSLPTLTFSFSLSFSSKPQSIIVSSFSIQIHCLHLTFIFYLFWVTYIKVTQPYREMFFPMLELQDLNSFTQPLTVSEFYLYNWQNLKCQKKRAWFDQRVEYNGGQMGQ